MVRINKINFLKIVFEIETNENIVVQEVGKEGFKNQVERLFLDYHWSNSHWSILTKLFRPIGREYFIEPFQNEYPTYQYFLVQDRWQHLNWHPIQLHCHPLWSQSTSNEGHSLPLLQVFGVLKNGKLKQFPKSNRIKKENTGNTSCFIMIRVRRRALDLARDAASEMPLEFGDPYKKFDWTQLAFLTR